MNLTDLQARIEALERRLRREREARTAAETIAEKGMRELYQRSRHLELLETIAIHANGCDDPATAIDFTICQICDFCDWPVGHAMRLEEDLSGAEAILVSAGSFHSADPLSHKEFERASRHARFPMGEGLPGRVWRTSGPVWVVDVLHDDNFPRRQAAQTSGLHAAFGFPVRIGQDVRLVLEFFSHRRLEPDPLLLQTLSQACAQLARVLERTAALHQADLGRVELERLVVEAETARRSAEQASETKSRFLANMSHEIRTPLNGVLGMVQAMQRDDLSAVQRQRLDVVRESGQGLLTILNDVLDLSKIEAGALEMEYTPVDLKELLKSVGAVFRPTAEAKGLWLKLKIDEEIGWRMGDPTRLRQLLQNLLSNAVKFTDRGGVSLSAREIAVDRVCFEIVDTGIGIAPEHQETIFASFAQADSSVTRRFGGTGLGLPICKQLAALMGGEVRVESRPGEGSTFLLELTLAKCAPQEAPDTTVDPGRGEQVGALRVLAAEDNAINRMVLEALLAGSGVELVLVGDGREALEAWRSEVFDLILMDVQMPVLDGPSAARAIRDLESQIGRRRTPILALTANTMAHQLDQYLQAGMDGVVGKPIEVTELFGAMEAALSNSAECVC